MNENENVEIDQLQNENRQLADELAEANRQIVRLTQRIYELERTASMQQDEVIPR